MALHVAPANILPPAVSDLPRCPSPRPRSSTEMLRQQSLASTAEQQMHARSQSAYVTRQRRPFLSISRDSGAVASTKGVCGHFTAVRCNQHFPSLPLSAPHQEAVSSPESTPPELEQQPSARQMRLHPEAIPHKISSPIPHNRHEEVEAGFSFSVRGYSSPPSETPPTTAQLPLVIPSPTCTHQLSGAESEHKPSRVAMVVSAQPPVALTTVRANSSFRHRSPGAPESTSPIRKLHPLRGCVSPQPLAAVKGFRLHTSPPSQSDDSKGAAPPPSPPTGGRNTALPHNTPLIMET